MATYYKRDTNPTNNNWNQADNWSTVSSASSTNTGTFPIAGDTANLDSGSTNVTVNVASACAILNMTGYAATITMNNTLTCSSTTTLGGTFAGTSALTLSGALTLTSNGVVVPTINFTGNNTKTLTGDLTISGTATITGNTTFAGTGNLITQGNFVMNGTLTGRTVERQGGTWSGSSTLSSALIFNGDSTISGTVAVGGSTDITWVSGTITTTGSTVNIAGSRTISVGNNITFATITGTATSASTLTLNADLYCANTSNANNNILAVSTAGGYKVYVSGNFGHATNIGTWTGTANIVLNGTGTWNNANLSVAMPVTINTAGTITLGTCTITTGATIVYTAGTISGASSLMRLNGNSTWDISTIPTRLNFTVVAATTLTLSSNFLAATFTHLGGVTVQTSGAYDVDVTTLVMGPNVTASVLRIVAGRTLTVAQLACCGGGIIGVTINSVTPGSTFNLVYTGTQANAFLSGVTITDMAATATGAVKLFDWYGTVSNSTGIRSVTAANIGGAGVTVVGV
jgi:hypothetical protein